jgi:hypothetical protein
MRLCICLTPILKSPYMMDLLTNVLIMSALWLSNFLQKSEWEFLVLPCEIVALMGWFWLSSQNPTLIPLVQNLGDYLLSTSFQCCFKYHTLLLNPLKCDGINHVECTSTIRIYALHHPTWHCTISCASLPHAKAPSHKHQLRSAF